MHERSVKDLLERMQTLSREGLKKEKAAIIGKIAHGAFTDEEQMLLRTELQRTLMESVEKRSKAIEELQGTEEEIKRQCAVTSTVAKKLAESDGKLCKIKKGQETITGEMAKAYAIIQKRQKNEYKEDFIFFGALAVFFAICVFVLIDRLFIH
ncbi:hypothetical protein NEDG_01831 [Nematocida displodere]|uniref:Uncharacterized protein n=1 Tax=Nematocida displodere TaxID=1805483 RepID=A0A177EHA3_9MICR|nr:hypothetical protein NEDG_01831 [Nematocida displodere]